MSEGAGPAPARPPDWRFGLLFAAITASALLWSAHALLNPLVLAFLLIYLISPFRAQVWARRLMVSAGAIGLLWLLSRLGSALLPFWIALAVAYFMDPFVDRLEERGIGRTLAIFALLVPAFIGISFMLVLALPPLIQQIVQFVRQVPAAVDVAIGYLDLIPDALASPEELEELVRSNLPNLLAPANALAQRVGSGAVGGVGYGVRVISLLVLTPLAAFYALRDIDRLKETVGRHIPRESRAIEILTDIDRMLGRYLRGQLIVCAVLGVMTWLGLWLLGVPYALLLGLLTGILNIVPIVGFWISFVPVILVSLTMPDPITSLIKVVVFYLVVQAVESYLISPRIVGDEIGLNPVVMILSIVVFSSLFGLVGVLLAVPIAGVLALLYQRWRDGAGAQSNR